MSQFSDDVLRARRQNLISVCTAAAGVAPGTVMGNTPPLTIWNPPGSKLRLILVRGEYGYISGTLGAGTVVVGGNTQVAAPTVGGGSDITTQIVSGIFGSPAAANAVAAGVKAYQGATLAAIPSIIKPEFILAASPSAAQPDFAEGMIGLLPGNALSFQAIAAAGASPLILLSMLLLAEKFEES